MLILTSPEVKSNSNKSSFTTKSGWVIHNLEIKIKSLSEIDYRFPINDISRIPNSIILVVLIDNNVFTLQQSKRSWRKVGITSSDWLYRCRFETLKETSKYISKHLKHIVKTISLTEAELSCIGLSVDSTDNEFNTTLNWIKLMQSCNSEGDKLVF